MDRLRFFTIRLILLTCLLTLTVGCGWAKPSEISQSTQLPVFVTPAQACVAPELSSFYSTFSEPIGYDRHSVSDLIDQVFVDFLGALRTPGPEMQTIKGRALNILTYETIRWSHVWNKTVDEKNKIRITFTFVSPDLIRAVILNHVILRLSHETNPRADINLQEYSNSALQKMDQRAKFLLLIIIQPETSNQSTSRIVIPQHISLNNIENLPTYKTQSDDFLHHALKFSDGQHSGVIFFPFGTINSTGVCTPILNTQQDTSITFVISGAQIASENSEEIFVEMPLAPAIPVDSTLPPMNPFILENGGEYAPRTTLPPIPTEATEYEKGGDLKYWTLVSLFIWQKLTLDYFGMP